MITHLIETVTRVMLATVGLRKAVEAVYR